MFRKLPNDCHLHTFSFLSSPDICLLKTVNKETKELTSEQSIWKDLLENEFGFSLPEERQDPENSYKELKRLYAEERARASSFEQKQIKEKLRYYQGEGYLEQLDKLKSNLDELYLEIAVKFNLTVLMRHLLANNKNQIVLNSLLVEACISLNLGLVQTLITLGADVNGQAIFCDNLCSPLCLSYAVLLGWNFPEKGKEIIKYLLQKSADVDVTFPPSPVETATTSTDQSITVREMCRRILSEEMPPAKKQLLDLIISAPKLTPDEPPTKKMRVY